MASDASVHDSEQPTETTALLTNRPTAASRTLPPIAPVVNHIRVHGLQTADDEATFSVSPSLGSRANEVSFKMIVFLQLYLLSKTAASQGRDVWERWSKEQSAVLDEQVIERRILSVWEEFLSINRSTQEIEDCLWTAFPLEEGRTRTVRVVDILKDPDAPFELISHRLVLLSFSHTWRYGRAVAPAGSPLARVAQIVDSKATPRVLHALDVSLQLAYLYLLGHYILYPPDRPIVTLKSTLVGAREVVLTIYSLASLCRPWTSYVVPSVMVAAAFLFSLPTVPFPGDTAYHVLLGAFPLHILLLHLPRTPSPNFLLAPDVSLPLSTLLWYEFTRTVYPVILFYLPAILISTYCMSMSLADSVPRLVVWVYDGAAPMETRGVLFVFWALLVLLVLASTVLLVMFSASVLSSSSRSSSPWDRYTQPVGLQARRIFATAVITYSTPYFFPPPFNLLHLTFVRLPVMLFHFRAGKELLVMEWVQTILWRCTVGPVALVVAGCWLWVASSPLSPQMGR